MSTLGRTEVLEVVDVWCVEWIPSGFRAAAWATDPASAARYYVKIPKLADQARVEVLANALYRVLGVRVPEVRLVTVDGRLAVASKAIPNATHSESGYVDAHAEIQSGFVADAWLANWDMKYSNVLVDQEGHVWRVDQGGCLHFRALGEVKTFESTVGELETLRDSVINPKATRIYGPIPERIIQDGILDITNLSDGLIDAQVRTTGFELVTEERLALVLKERRDWLRSHGERYNVG